MGKAFVCCRFRERGRLIVVGWLLALVLSACKASELATNAGPLPTVAPTQTVALIPTNTLSLESGPAGAVESGDHTHPINAPEHIHLEDGSVVATEGLPIENDLLAQLLNGEPIPVGPANASAQTVALTISTMF
jgi:hypothetical protein